MTEQTFSIPEYLGFLGTEDSRRKHEARQRAYSQMSYRVMYLLYEDEADELLTRFAPDEQARNTAHPHIHRELMLRFARDPEYRDRVLGQSDEGEDA
jgi:hypothetical protein